MSTTVRSVRPSAAGARPSLRMEKRLLREGHTCIAAVDEVGRGAPGGPVSAGVVLVDATVNRPLVGVRDSKLLTPEARVALVPRVRRWALAGAVGHASAQEIDAYGLTAALRLAGHRALAALLAEQGAGAPRPDVVLLDGNYDWLTPPEQHALFGPAQGEWVPVPRVVTMIKADMRCASVAAASVLAKTARDALMVELAAAHPEYGWDENKGYSTPAHLDALRRLGPCFHHRRTWRLPDLAADREVVDADDLVVLGDS